MHHTVIYEATPTGLSAYVPDLPGLRGRREDAERGRASHPPAIRSHVAMMRSMGERVPAPSTWSDTVVAQDA